MSSLLSLPQGMEEPSPPPRRLFMDCCSSLQAALGLHSHSLGQFDQPRHSCSSVNVQLYQNNNSWLSRRWARESTSVFYTELTPNLHSQVKFARCCHCSSCSRLLYAMEKWLFISCRLQHHPYSPYQAGRPLPHTLQGTRSALSGVTVVHPQTA